MDFFFGAHKNDPEKPMLAPMSTDLLWPPKLYSDIIYYKRVLDYGIRK